MTVDMREGAIHQAGEAVMRFMIRNHVVGFSATLGSETSDSAASARLLDMIERSHIALAGPTAVGLVAENLTPEISQAGEDEVRSIFSEVIDDPNELDRLVDYLKGDNHDFLYRHAHVLESVAKRLAQGIELTGSGIEDFLVAAFSNEEEHWTWAVAGQAVAAHMCNGLLHGVCVGPKNPTLPAFHCDYEFPKTEGFERLEQSRATRLRLPRHKRKLSGLGTRMERSLRKYAHGQLDQQALLRIKIAHRKTADSLAGGVDLSAHREFHSLMHQHLVVAFAADVSQRIALGDVLTSVETVDSRLIFAAWLAGSPEEAQQILDTTRSRAEIIIRTYWPAVESVSQALTVSGRAMSGEDARNIIDAAVSASVLDPVA